MHVKVNFREGGGQGEIQRKQTPPELFSLSHLISPSSPQAESTEVISSHDLWQKQLTFLQTKHFQLHLYNWNKMLIH